MMETQNCELGVKMISMVSHLLVESVSTLQVEIGSYLQVADVSKMQSEMQLFSRSKSGCTVSCIIGAHGQKNFSILTPKLYKKTYELKFITCLFWQTASLGNQL